MLLIFTKMLMIGIMIAVGILIYRLKIVSYSGSREISALIVNICSPVMVVSSALADTSEFSLQKLGVTLVSTLIFYLIFILFGALIPILLGIPKEKRPFYSMLSVFGNCGFIGIPLALSILGTECMLYVVFFNIFYNLFFYSYGYQTIAKVSGKEMAFKPSSLLNPGIISCVIALAIYLLPISLPEFLVDTMDYISSCTTFLSMVVLGVNIASTPLKKMLAVPKMYVFYLLRILVLPIVLSFVIKPLFSDSMMVSAFLLMSAVPAGSMTVMLATQQQAETDTLSSGVIISTLMCLLTIPIVSYFFPT